jgi:glycosyltransferase involved in cell wall biosynthesis
VTERLRIAVLSRNFSVTGGGAERYSIALVEQMAATHEVHVFAQTIDHQFPCVTYHRIPLPLRRPRWINQLYFAWATWRATRKGFDIVHSHENTWHGNVQTVHVLPVTYTLFAGKHGVALALRWLKVLTSPRLLAYLWLEGRRFAKPSKRSIVATSESLGSSIEQFFPVVASMLTVVTPGVEIVRSLTRPLDRQNARQELNLPSRVVMMLFVGNDMEKKGLPVILNVMKKIPSVHLAVVGSGEHDLAMMVMSEEIADRVHFLGSLSDVSNAYLAADMFVHPTTEDSYGMVVLEAMSFGLPTIVSGAQYCGISRELRHKVDALVVEHAEDKAAWRHWIELLIADRELGDTLASAGIEFAKSRTWLKASQRYEEIMHKIVRV